MANATDFIVKSGLVVKTTTTVPSKENLVTTNVVRTTSRPSIDINFTRSNSLDPRLKFTRSSGATYVGSNGIIQYAGVNTPRFDYDPNTLQSKGVLVEEQITNISTYGSNVGNPSGWNLQLGSAGSAAFVQNYAVAPDGTQSATFLYHANNVVTYKNLNQGVTINTNTNYTFSIWAKNVGETYISATHFDGHTGLNSYNFNYNWTTDTFSSVTIQGSTETSVAAPSRDIYPNGWIRIKYTTAWNSGPSRSISLKWELSGANASTATGFYLWGSQVETTTVNSNNYNPTSYIPTLGSQVTRSVDILSMTPDATVLNPVQGTFFVDFDANNTSYSFALNSNTMGEIATCRGTTDVGTWNGIAALDAINSAANNNTGARYAISYDGKNFRANNVLSGGTISSSNQPPIYNTAFGATNFYLGCYSSNFRTIDGHMKRFTYWSTMLSTGTLQLITQMI